MITKVKTVFDVRRRKLLFVSLFVGVLLLFSLFSYMLMAGAGESSLEEVVVHVGSARDLQNAVKNAPDRVSVVIVLDNDIILRDSALGISANKSITLRSGGVAEFYQLIGAVRDSRISTIGVRSGGVLVLDGVVVTHAEGCEGRGVYVFDGGTLIMYDGKISGNTNPDAYVSIGTRSGPGGGVCNYGVFKMYGGEITNNTAGKSGGGVWNVGTFIMYNGKISNNSAEYGGGVYNYATFTMSGGEITGNVANRHGGGVYNYATFTMSGGEITGNTADVAGGVGNWGTFTMHNGKITGNYANQIGGGVFHSTYYGTFDKRGGEISGNIAPEGNNVYSLGDNDEQTTVNDYTVRNMLVICVGITVMVVVTVVLFLYFKSYKRGIRGSDRKFVLR